MGSHPAPFRAAVPPLQSRQGGRHPDAIGQGSLEGLNCQDPGRLPFRPLPLHRDSQDRARLTRKARLGQPGPYVVFLQQSGRYPQHLEHQAEAVFAAIGRRASSPDRQYLRLHRPEAITDGSTVCTFFRFHKDRDRYGGFCHIVGRPEDVEHAIRRLSLECVRLRYLRGLKDLCAANERL